MLPSSTVATHQRLLCPLAIPPTEHFLLQTIGAKQAAALDQELMSSGGYSIDQLMELAGLAVSSALYKLHPPTQQQSPKILIACGPGNNGGDGLVAARHLHHFGYAPTVLYPKQSKNELYQRLCTQLRGLHIPFTTEKEATENIEAGAEYTYILDAIFGFSFSGQVRDPFGPIISALERTKTPVLAVDAPSSWNIDTGPPDSGPGSRYMPTALISLTAPKPLVKWFRGGRHFVGGRFLSLIHI